MGTKRQRGFAGNGSLVTVLVGTLVTFGVVACGEDFSGDCKANRTCPESGGAPNEEPSSGGAGETASSTSIGGAGAESVAGQGGADSGCRSHEDCDNGDPTDGAELCREDGVCSPGNAPPVVVAVAPDADASLVELDAAITITFSEALDPASVTSSNIRLWDRDKQVEADLAHADGVVTLTPARPLALLAEYSLQITTAVTDAAGAPLLEEHTSTFRTRDGLWQSEDAVVGIIYWLANTLPVTATGDTLVAWITRMSPSSSVYCPPSARWFNGGKPASPTKVFQHGEGVYECSEIAVGANAAGVAAIAWQEEFKSELVHQFRDGQWVAAPLPVTTLENTRYFGLGVAPDGAVSFLQPGVYGSFHARITDADGTWGAPASDLASNHRSLSAPQLAFASSGEGFAVWRSEVPAGNEEIMVARYTTAGGWATAQVMPGSVAPAADATSERGTPAVAVDEEGGAMAVWVREAGVKSELVASRYTASGGWAMPVPISGTLVVSDTTKAPGLVFDGTSYVASWVGVDGASTESYSARYDLDFEEWDAYEQRSAGTVLNRMPALGVDGHGNLLMTWITLGMSIEYARFDGAAGKWSSADAVDGAVIKDEMAMSSRPTPLGVGVNGHGAIMWGDEDAQGEVNKIRLASFH